jgi:hypothetical protein
MYDIIMATIGIILSVLVIVGVCIVFAPFILFFLAVPTLILIAIL